MSREVECLRVIELRVRMLGMEEAILLEGHFCKHIRQSRIHIVEIRMHLVERGKWLGEASIM